MLGDGQQASVYKFENTEPGKRGATRGVIKPNHCTQEATANSSVLEASYEAAGIWITGHGHSPCQVGWPLSLWVYNSGENLKQDFLVFSASGWESELRKDIVLKKKKKKTWREIQMNHKLTTIFLDS